MSADEQPTTPEVERHHDFVIAVDVVRERIDRLVGEMQPTYRQRGFRKGKVPAELIRRQNLTGLQAQALQDAVSDRIQEWDDDPDQARRLGRPSVEFVGDGSLEEALKSEQDVAMRLRVEYMPEVPDLTQFKLAVTRPRVEVTDADARCEVNALRDERYPGTPVEGTDPVQDKDILVVKATPVGPDAKADASAQHVSLTLGEAELGTDVDAALAGQTIGNSIEAVGTLPGADEAGRRREPARLQIVILAALRPPPPELSDVIAQELDFANLDELVECARLAVEDQAKHLERILLQGRLYAALAEHLAFDVPPSVLRSANAAVEAVTSTRNPAEGAGWEPDSQRIARFWVARRAFFQARGIQLTPDDLIRAARPQTRPAPVTEEERSAMQEHLRQNAPIVGAWHATASRKRFFEELALALELSESDSIGFDEAKELAQNHWGCLEVLYIPG